MQEQLQERELMVADVIPEPKAEQPRPRVARNAAIYFVGQYISWFITLVTLSIIPRYMGEGAMGKIAVASTIVNTVGMIFALGLEPYLIKEFGRDRAATEYVLRAALGLRIVVVVPAMLFSLGALWLSHPDKTLWTLGLLNILLLLPMFLAGPLGAMVAGWENARLYSVLALLLSCAPLVALPFLRFGPVALLGGLLFVWGLNWIVAWREARRHVCVRPIVDIACWKSLFRSGMPFLINEYVMTIYTFGAVFLVRHYAGDSAVGVLSQADKLIGTSLLFPTSLALALLPSIARMADNDLVAFRQMQRRMVNLLVVLGLPVVVLILMLATPFSQLLYGTERFQALPAVLRAFAFNILPVYIVTIMYRFLQAQDKVAVWTRFLLVTVLIKVAACALLIPLTLRVWGNGGIGAAVSSVLGEACAVLFAFRLMDTNPLAGGMGARMLRSLLAAGVMAGVLWLTLPLYRWSPLINHAQGMSKLTQHLVHAVLLGASTLAGLTVFILLGWLLRILTDEDRERIGGLVRRKLLRRAA